MPSLETRVAELERKNAMTDGFQQHLIILVPVGMATEELTSLRCNRTGQVWNRQPDETVDGFKERVKACVFAGDAPLLALVVYNG